jgi:hypothetical protein
MTNDNIACLRLLADWHDRQARYLLLSVPAGQHDQGRFHFMAAARLSLLADEATISRSGGEAQLTGLPRPHGQEPGRCDEDMKTRTKCTRCLDTYWVCVPCPSCNVFQS